MEISRQRNFCHKGLKIAFSILLFQIVLLAPVPDAIDLGYDLAFLKKPGTANFVKRALAPRFPNETIAALDRSDRSGQVLWPTVLLGQKKHMLQKRRTSVSDEDDGPPVFSVGMTPAVQGLSSNTFHSSVKRILHFIPREITQLKFSDQELFLCLGQRLANWLTPDLCPLAGIPQSGLGLRRPSFSHGIADRISPVVDFAFHLPLRNVHDERIPS
jgi:hypothetical protein